MTISNFAEDIERAAGGDPIEAIVVGDEMWDFDTDENEGPDGMEPLIPKVLRREVQPWELVRSWLDRNYDDGFGGAGCWPIYAWTANRVILVHEYDGATTVGWIPRHPCATNPKMA